jgi:Helix-turn-helix family
MRETETRARRMWRVLEPFHALTYFSPHTRAATDELGLVGGWMSYFACRAAPLGAASAPMVTAAFYTFHPAMVARAIPEAWRRTRPEAVLRARLQALDRAVHQDLPGAASEPEMALAAELARAAVEVCSVAGCVLGAANTALPWPEDPHLALWQAVTVLREQRGDVHVAALLTAGLTPTQALVTAAAAGGPPAEVLQRNRGWSDTDWRTAVLELIDRGLLDGDHHLTSAGRDLRAAVEATTDTICESTWRKLGDARTDELARLVAPLSATLLRTGRIPVANPIGLQWTTQQLTG